MLVVHQTLFLSKSSFFVHCFLFHSASYFFRLKLCFSPGIVARRPLIFKPCQCGRAAAHYHWSCHLRRKLRRDETTAGWCIGGPRLSLGSLRSACFGRSSPLHRDQLFCALGFCISPPPTDPVPKYSHKFDLDHPSAPPPPHTDIELMSLFDLEDQHFEQTCDPLSLCPCYSVRRHPLRSSVCPLSGGSNPEHREQNWGEYRVVIKKEHFTVRLTVSVYAHPPLRSAFSDF